MATYDTASLLAAVKRRAFVPTAQSTFAATETLAVATEELHSYLAPLMMEVREEYFVAAADLPLVALQRDYRIPARAMGGKLRDVVLLDSGATPRNLVRLEPEAAAALRATDTGTPEAFSLQGNYVRLHPTPPDASHTLRLTYFSRPGALVETSAAGAVKAVDYAAGTLTLSGAAPAAFVLGVRLDVVGAQPGFSTIASELTLTGLGLDGSDAVLTFAALPQPESTPLENPVTAPEEVSVGDWVCLAGESPVPQVPPELHPLLALKTAAALLEAIGDTEAAKTLLGELVEKQRRALALLSPRTEGEPRKVGNGMSKWRGRCRLY